MFKWIVLDWFAFEKRIRDCYLSPFFFSYFDCQFSKILNNSLFWILFFFHVCERESQILKYYYDYSITIVFQSILHIEKNLSDILNNNNNNNNQWVWHGIMFVHLKKKFQFVLCLKKSFKTRRQQQQQQQTFKLFL